MITQTKFASIVAEKLNSLGMEIPEDLRLLAAHEEEFKAHMFKAQHGIAQDNQSTMLLKEALAAGQKGKAGIGFKGKGDQKSHFPKNRFEEDEDLIDKYKEMVDTIKQKEYQLRAAELMGHEEGVNATNAGLHSEEKSEPIHRQRPRRSWGRLQRSESFGE